MQQLIVAAFAGFGFATVVKMALHAAFVVLPVPPNEWIIFTEHIVAHCAGGFLAARLGKRREWLYSLAAATMTISIQLLAIRWFPGILSGYRQLQSFEYVLQGVGVAVPAFLFGGCISYTIAKYRDLRILGPVVSSSTVRALFIVSGSSLLLFGAYCMLLGTVSFFYVAMSGQGLFLVAMTWFAAFTCAMLGKFSNEAGRRLVKATKAVDESGIGTLVLRAFSDDSITLTNERNLAPPFGMFIEMLMDCALDVAISNAFKADGNIISLGSPSEDLPRVGTSRPYFATDLEWQRYILDALEKAKRIVLIPSDSDSLQWEMRQLFGSNFLKKLIVVFPPSTAVLTKTVRWESFLNAALQNPCWTQVNIEDTTMALNFSDDEEPQLIACKDNSYEDYQRTLAEIKT